MGNRGRWALCIIAIVGGCGGPPRSEDLATVHEALTTTDVMGLESASGWSTTTSGARLSSSTTHDQGSFSLQVDPSTTNGYTPILSVPLTKPTVVGPQMAFDVMLPTKQANPNWFGTVQMYVNCPSRGIYSQFLTQVELTGKPVGVFNTVTFPVPSAIVAGLLNGGYTDLQFTLVLNVAVPAQGPYFLDNLRFLPAAANGCGGLPNGTFCDDANACTTGESCQGGACGGGAAVTCAGADSCHTVGACVPATGCPAPVAKPNGTTCNDANACTTGETCQAGVCGGGAAVTCAAPADSCHTQGACVPATGCPAQVVKANGSSCDDGDVCTTGETCTAGACGGGTRQIECSLTPSINWVITPHFIGTDTPPPACPLPAAFQSTPGAFAFECQVNGAQGCEVVQVPFFQVLQACTAQPCADGTGSACTLSCGGTGIKRCSGGQWGACQAFERCNGLDDDCDGVIDNGGVCQVPLSLFDPTNAPGFDTVLDACGSSSTSSPITQFDWNVQIGSGPPTHVSSPACISPFVFPAEGGYPVTLTLTTQDGQRTTGSGTITIKNHVIVSMGDSIASGEGNPDIEAENNGGVPVWQDKRCHRSLVSWHAQAAKRLEDADPRSSVTFLPVACSGASITTGILNQYGGQQPDGVIEPAQIDAVHAVLGGQPRAIDALLVQIGANDVGFGDQVRNCAIPSFSRPSDTDLFFLGLAGFPELAAALAFLPDGDLFTCATSNNINDSINPALANLGGNLYPQLDANLRSRLALARTNGIYISEYPDPSHSDNGSFCSEIRLNGAVTDQAVPLIPDAAAVFLIDPVQTFPLFALLGVVVAANPDGVISGQEVIFEHDHFIDPLNQVVATAAATNNWTFIGGINQAGFATHGYCATQRWFRHYDESKTVEGTKDGTLHPNVAGHNFYGFQLGSALIRDLFANGN
jgi:hypothetical protein